MSDSTKQVIVALISGVIFGVGLTISQMVDPNKVINFLDLAGNWDPSLAFVMMGALGVFGLGNWLFIKKQSKPAFSENFSLPNKQTLDKTLIIGSSLFGIGWGLAGICPGPAITNTLSFNLDMIYFIVAMLAGMVIVNKIKT